MSAKPRMTRSPLLSRLTIAGVALYSLGVVIHLSLNLYEFQWDFKTYYSAANAFLQGLNPYPLETLNEVSGSNIQFRYVYPPLTLWAFAPFVSLPYETSATSFLFLKILATLTLIRLWATCFLDTPHWALFSLFCLFGFNATFYSDFSAGNISVFEQLALWTAFLFFLRERYVAFAALVLLTASFKLAPILFLGLLWCTDYPRKHRLIAASLGVFATSMLLTWLVSPDLFLSFLDNLSQPGGRGWVNPSSFVFISRAVERIGEMTGFQLPPIVSVLTFAVIISALMFIAIATVRNGISLDDPQRAKTVLYFLIVTYALLLPRFKDYSFILLIVPAYFILLKSRLSAIPVLFVLFMIPFHSALPGLGFLANYSSLWLAGFLFYLYVLEFKRVVRGKSDFPNSWFFFIR